MTRNEPVQPVPDNQEPILFVTEVGSDRYLHLLIHEVEALRKLPAEPSVLTFEAWRSNLDAMVDELAAIIKARALYTLKAGHHDPL